MIRRAFLISIFFSFVFCTRAQASQKYSYQAVARNAQHTVSTNAVGLTNMVIGEGSASSRTFEDILWGENLHFLKVEVDPAEGSSYELIGTSQMISDPYSLYAGYISSPTRKFTVQEEAGHPVDSALFEVHNAEGHHRGTDSEGF